MVARRARNYLLYSGCYAHILSRSMRNMQVFQDPEDFETFKRLLLRIKSECEFRIFHYCLMNTHFHLAVRIQDPLLFSKGLQKIKSQYIYRFHDKYKISGPIWRERFRSLLIENEAYLYACGQYIENNPVKAGLVTSRVDWKYSSSQHYAQYNRDPLVDDYYEDNPPTTPKDVDLNNEEMFERGAGIGSGFFRYQLKEKLKS